LEHNASSLRDTGVDWRMILTDLSETRAGYEVVEGTQLAQDEIK